MQWVDQRFPRCELVAMGGGASFDFGFNFAIKSAMFFYTVLRFLAISLVTDLKAITGILFVIKQPSIPAFFENKA
ncbi:hypothetical protein RSP673_024860 (plasmid) [Ralstonia solanacearum P673]|uniref:hypothetical protein n=1 Tax=Ralstonia solanacearum TaxID=305 RepID=UPI00202A23AE|nr:hypothetical protein [Ralstonia solanacearum]MCL9850472.1 hypothetical protein [Ralstonia solanacearum]MCL9856615.1 hypothetical protein [Ralstonia solanacearum]MCL9866258.1 hypothetical protein [Ralstonia solanacearum]MCL9870986.1 hypothetical protein [Ralstonia solanacearum]MCL9875858.1 hypothetical protein [Ralstonia solanacearum]